MNISQLDADTDFLCGSTSATYSTTAKRRNHNIAYHDVARIIWASDNDWHFDDSNNTDTPIARKTLGHLSATYTIPTTALRIEQVTIKDNGGTDHILTAKRLSDYTTPLSTLLTTNVGLPTEYILEGNEMTLVPTPHSGNVTLASGVAVRLSRAVNEIAVSATTSVPGFATPFHRILSYAAAIDFTKDNSELQFFMQQRERLEQGLVKFYSKRADEYPTRITPHGKKNWQQYT